MKKFISIFLLMAIVASATILTLTTLPTALANSLGEWIDITNKSYIVQDSVMHDVKVVSEGKSYSTVTSLAEGESKTQSYKVNGSGTVEDGKYESNNLMDLGLTPGATYSNKGITITVNPDLSINAKGTAAEELTFNFCNQEKNPLIWGKPSNFKINLGQEVTLYDNSNNSGYLFQFVFYDINNKIYWLPKGTFNFKFESNLFLGRILIRKGVTVDFDFKPQIIFGKESSYSPYANEDYTYSSTTIPALKGGKIYGNVLEGNAKVYIKPYLLYNNIIKLNYLQVPVCEHINNINYMIGLINPCNVSSCWRKSSINSKFSVSFFDNNRLGYPAEHSFYLNGFNLTDSDYSIVFDNTSGNMVSTLDSCSLPYLQTDNKVKSVNIFNKNYSDISVHDMRDCEPLINVTYQSKYKLNIRDLVVIINYGGTANVVNATVINDYNYCQSGYSDHHLTGMYEIENSFVETVKADLSMLISNNQFVIKDNEVIKYYDYTADEKYEFGKDDGYDEGYDIGYDKGYDKGFAIDKNSKVNEEISKFLKSWKGLLPNIFGSMASFFLVLGEITIFGSTLTELVVSLCGLVFLFFIVKLIFAR